MQLFSISFFGGAQGKSGPLIFWQILALTVGYLGLFTFGLQAILDWRIAAGVYFIFFCITTVGFWFLTTGNYGRLLRYVVLVDNTT